MMRWQFRAKAEQSRDSIQLSLTSVPVFFPLGCVQKREGALDGKTLHKVGELCKGKRVFHQCNYIPSMEKHNWEENRRL